MRVTKSRHKRHTRNPDEEKVYRSLKKAKVNFVYEGLKIPYVIAAHYVPDFIIATPTGRIYVETKGYLRPEDKRKLIAVRKCNPSMDLRIVFFEKKKAYIRWAERNRFKYAIETIPKEWLQGL